MQASKKRVAVLGSSGSIGTQTLDVISRHADKLELVALALNSQVGILEQQARQFGVGHVALGASHLENDPCVDGLRNHIDTCAREGLVQNPHIGFGFDAVEDLVRLPEVDIVVNAVVGAAGLRLSYEALKAGKQLGLANKESLVVGGDLIMPLATHDTLLPIDSEHGAIYQCLLGENPDEVEALWVTASGGPFRGRTRDGLKNITPEQALAHPTWNMGAKISIDSATLMNKGLEVIEAHHLFSMPYDRIKVLVQPQSAIHSMVEFKDGSVKAHLGTTDMRIPIQFALSYPDRWSALVKNLDFRSLGSLEFDAPDTKTFACLALAQEAGKCGQTMPCVMNAANEIAVASFLSSECAFLQIASCVEAVMNLHIAQRVESLDQLEEVDFWARTQAQAYLKEHAWT
ncbi:MAG: 1-deoxy-D-xylulose-5-phosphate reductoisomerase [Raoultibacter sp.]|jgi:1-deoxy-D-xylulose-5-phosphate reductoisomerase